MRVSSLLVVLAASLVVPWVIACSDDDSDANQGDKTDAGDVQETGLDQDTSPNDDPDAPDEAATNDASPDQTTEPDAPVDDPDAPQNGEWGEFQECYDCAMLHCGAEVGACFEDETCAATVKCVLEEGCLTPTLDYTCALTCALSNGADIANPALSGLVMGGAGCISDACPTQCGM